LNPEGDIMVVPIVVAAAALPVAVLAYAATKPATFQVQRSMRIDAPPEAIFPLIQDFHSWSAWSPWEGLDPGMTRTHSGAARGKGAVYGWSGNRKVGEGRMEITDVAAPSRVDIKLDFLKPFEAHNLTDFKIERRGDATEVTWTMRGPNTYMGKVMSVFVSMDRMIGKDFEAGLEKLKAAAESS
jgi:hypothetical protein